MSEPRTFEVFYSGLVSDFRVRDTLSASIMIRTQQDDEYIKVIEYSAFTKLQEKLKVAEDFIAERCCIDYCGFDVHSEPTEVLRSCMIAIDLEGREALKKIRGDG